MNDGASVSNFDLFYAPRAGNPRLSFSPRLHTTGRRGLSRALQAPSINIFLLSNLLQRGERTQCNVKYGFLRLTAAVCLFGLRSCTDALMWFCYILQLKRLNYTFINRYKSESTPKLNAFEVWVLWGNESGLLSDSVFFHNVNTINAVSIKYCAHKSHMDVELISHVVYWKCWLCITCPSVEEPIGKHLERGKQPDKLPVYFIKSGFLLVERGRHQTGVAAS